ncbi:MAG: hypothetical protein ABI855_01065 [Bacteroidota bacterium]
MTEEEKIFQLVKDKGITSIEVFNKSKIVFESIKTVLQQMETELKSKMSAVDPRVQIEFEDKGRLEVHLKVANDVLVFLMHTSIFVFDESHYVFKSSYLKEDPLRAFCGMIYVYNFLTDTFKFHRTNDKGVLVARLFVNKENHFVVDGKKHLATLFNDFNNDEVTEEKLKQFIHTILIQVLENDLNVPSFDAILLTTLQELQDSTSQSGFNTGKHFGFVLPGSKEEG